MNGPGEKTVTLGTETDNALRQTILRVLKHMGAKAIDDSWALGGSQVVETLDVEIDGQALRIEAETYMGLSLTGPADLVDRIAEAVASNMETKSAQPSRKEP